MSLFSPSSQQADTLFAAFTLIGTIGGLFALLGGAGAYWASTVREKYAEERTQKNELDIAAANKGAAEAQVMAQRISLEAAVANQVAAEAQLRTLQLQQHLGPRRLTPAQKSTLQGALRGKLAYISIAFSGDPEVAQYARDFQEVFAQIGINPGRVQGGIAREIGLQIVHTGGPEAQILRDALQSIGVQANVRTRRPQDMVYNALTLVVGDKSPPSRQ